jgi:RimJ/RimL family protein N-acetyltransferase
MIIETEKFLIREFVASDAEALLNMFMDICRKTTQSILDEHLVFHKTKFETYGLNLSKYLYKSKFDEPNKIIDVKDKDLFIPFGLFNHPYEKSIDYFLHKNSYKQKDPNRFSYMLGLEDTKSKELIGLTGFTHKVYQISNFHRSGYFISFLSPTSQGQNVATRCRSVIFDLLYKYFLRNSKEYVYLFSSFHPLNTQSMKFQEKFGGMNMFPNFAKPDRIDYYFEKERVYNSKGMSNAVDFVATTDKGAVIKRIESNIIKTR